MNRDDVIRMALESGFAYRPTDDHLVVEEVHGYSEVVVTAGLERFAALVAAHEREECAAACGNLQLAHAGRADLTADQCADAIRARKA